MRIATLSALALLISCDSAGSSGQTKKSEHSPEAVAKRADEVYETFQSLHDNLPAAGVAAKPCPDEKIREWSGEGRKNEVVYLAYQSLRRSVGEPWDGNNSIVRFITNSKLRYPPKAELKLDKQNNIKQLMRMWDFVQYIGVLVPTAERKAKAATALSGDAGAFLGQLVIYRKGEPQPLCHAPLKVRPTGDVTYRYELGDNSSNKKSKAEHAMKKSLCAELKKVLDTQIGSISKLLESSSVDCNGV